MAVHSFIRKIDSGEVIQQFGDGTTSRDYTYVSDCVDGILACLSSENPNSNNEIFNIGRGQPLRLSLFIETIANYLGKKPIIQVLPMQAGDVTDTFADISKANLAFGYSPKVTIQEGLRRTVRWYLKQFTEKGDYAKLAQRLASPCLQPLEHQNENQSERASLDLEPIQLSQAKLFGPVAPVDQLAVGPGRADQQHNAESQSPHPAAPSASSDQHVAPSSNSQSAAHVVEPFADVVSCTRLFNSHGVGLPEDTRAALCRWIQMSLQFSGLVAIAVDTTNNRSDLVEAVSQLIGSSLSAQLAARVHLVGVSPWSDFTPALNSLLLHAKKHSQLQFIFYSSVEIEAHPHHVRLLRQALMTDSRVLVCGARLDGMQFKESADKSSCVVDCTGVTTPWNTAAMWRTASLQRTGFLAVSDGITIQQESIAAAPLSVPGGVEEVVVIALQQRLFPDAALAIVCDVNSHLDNGQQKLVWHQSWQEANRVDYHARKMASKIGRAQAQLDLLQLLPGKVRHATAAEIESRMN